jgi:hypothetical protein
VSQSAESDNELCSENANWLRERLLGGGALPTLSRAGLEILIGRLKEYVCLVSERGDYDEARIAQSLLDDLVRMNHRNVFGRSHNDAALTRYRAARADLEEELC